MIRHLIFVSLLLVCSAAPQQFSNNPATPVPILKQISKANEDGSYTYGYEGGDGSFKIETRYQTGEVVGKYGYIDTFGNLKTVEYGANKLGFQPSGKGINVPPPTIPREGDEYDDGQYREENTFTQPRRQQQTFRSYQSPQQTFNNFQQPRQQTFNNFQQPRQQTFNNFQQDFNFQQPQHNFNTNTRPTISNLPAHIPPSIFNGHPARSIDLASGSYTLSYGG